MVDRARTADPEILGVVGWVDLCSPGVRDDLARFEGELVGVRHSLQAESDDAFMLRESFVRGLTALQERGLVYDLLIFPRHLANAETWLDFESNGSWSTTWRSRSSVTSKLNRGRARCTGSHAFRMFPASCRASSPRRIGAVSPPEDLLPYLEIAVDAFGPERLLFGSDWPVCLVAASYSSVREVVQSFVERLSPSERAAVLGGNAARWYGLANTLTAS